MGRENLGIDIATNVLHHASEIAQRFGFVIRYYSHNPSKNLTEPELQALLGAGLRVGTVWETAGDHPSFFTAAQGKADARDALRMASELGQHLGSTIYFAVDCDTVPGSISHGVVAYFAAIHESFIAAGVPYLIGVYGSGTICEAVRGLGFATHSWLAQSTKWSGYHSYKEYDMIQGPKRDGFGTNFDPNTVRDGGDAGLFPLA